MGAEGEGAATTPGRQLRDAAVVLGGIGSLVAVEQTRSRPVARTGKRSVPVLRVSCRGMAVLKGPSGVRRTRSRTARCADSRKVRAASTYGRTPFGRGLGITRVPCVWIVARTNELRPGYTAGGPSVPRRGNCGKRYVGPCPVPGRPNPRAERRATFAGTPSLSACHFSPSDESRVTRGHRTFLGRHEIADRTASLGATLKQWE